MRVATGLVRRCLALAPACVCAALAVAPAAHAAPAPVPCSAAGSGKYDCQFYPSGNSYSAGAPVQASDASEVGYLNSGTNWVTCQAVGGTVISGQDENNWWAYTEANDGRWGWVNAVWASGGDNFGPFGGVPACPSNVGLPPGAQAPPSSGSSVTPPAASPPPAPTVRHLGVAIQLSWHVTVTRTRVQGIRFLHLPPHARIAISCRGQRCHVPRRSLAWRAAQRALTRNFASGDVVRLTITDHGYVPEVAELHFRRGRGPRGRLVSS